MNTYSIFRQIKSPTEFIYGGRDLKANPHYVHVGNGMYLNKVHPEVCPMQEIASGFSDKNSLEKAIDLFIEIDKLRGVTSTRVSPQNPLLRVA
jgi:hypothetical protein